MLVGTCSPPVFGAMTLLFLVIQMAVSQSAKKKRLSAEGERPRLCTQT